MYNLLKPPKFGNCTIDQQHEITPLITISDIKQTFGNTANLSALDDLKKKINSLVENGNWEFSDVFEHDYNLSPVKECLIYYLVGYLSKQILKTTKCTICIEAFKNPHYFSNLPEAELVNLKSKGRLVHPNYYFYKFISNIETHFSNNINDPDVYSNTVEDILANEHLNFPCSIHKDEIVAYSIRYYLNMRMRQFSWQINQEKLKENSKRKKISKFCKT